jgi:methionyl-tRNA synthetase
METVLWTTAEPCAAIAILCQPYVPGSAAKLLDLLACRRTSATSRIWRTRSR